MIQGEGQVLRGPLLEPLSWYAAAGERNMGGTNHSVWSMKCDSRGLSRTPALMPFHATMLREVRLGHIVRQEAVSMIPAVLLGLRHHHTVVDLCAAPGSKTEQLLSLMEADLRESAHSCEKNTHHLPTGAVLANDCDPKRIKLMQVIVDSIARGV